MTKLFIIKCLFPLFCLFSSVALSKPIILVVGDSLSAAYGIDQQAGWVNLLSQRLEVNYPQYDVVNSSIDGNTTAEGLARLPDLLKKYQPALVLLELGANDGLRGMPIKDIQANLSKMIELCQAQKSEVILLGMRIPPNYGPQYAEQFANLYADLSKEYKTALVPFFMQGIADNPVFQQTDLLHPDTAAQPQLLLNVWPILEPFLKK